MDGLLRNNSARRLLQKNSSSPHKTTEKQQKANANGKPVTVDRGFQACLLVSKIQQTHSEKITQIGDSWAVPPLTPVSENTQTDWTKKKRVVMCDAEVDATLPPVTTTGAIVQTQADCRDVATQCTPPCTDAADNTTSTRLRERDVATEVEQPENDVAVQAGSSMYKVRDVCVQSTALTIQANSPKPSPAKKNSLQASKSSSQNSLQSQPNSPMKTSISSLARENSKTKKSTAFGSTATKPLPPGPKQPVPKPPNNLPLPKTTPRKKSTKNDDIPEPIVEVTTPVKRAGPIWHFS